MSDDNTETRNTAALPPIAELEAKNEIASALNRLHGSKLLDTDPSAWLRRAVQLNVGLLYRHMLSTPTNKELVDISKALVAQRRKTSKPRGLKSGRRQDEENFNREEFNEELKTVIRQIYGVNLQTDAIQESQATIPVHSG